MTPLVNNFGSAQCTIAVPNVPGLVGIRFFTRGLLVDPQVNAFGAVLSNAAESVIGAR